MMGRSGEWPPSMAGLGAGVVGPAGRGASCARPESGGPTTAAPASVAPLSKPRRLKDELDLRFDIFFSRSLPPSGALAILPRRKWRGSGGRAERLSAPIERLYGPLVDMLLAGRRTWPFVGEGAGGNFALAPIRDRAAAVRIVGRVLVDHVERQPRGLSWNIRYD